ncbi:hypothetical protein RhiirC2_710528 [Rhizophagus irregularis]|uniref:Uncharacterized protein n=1 Tax=Rhizophagus irregularis TaxID=588596 RepID=A0A2N1NEE6_9GLOM|nr:hypothetical protein RhiirC2_710528 [Rhizophagus irregularis]
MAKSSDYNSLNPVVVQVLNNLQYKYSGETSEMWYSHVHYPFKTLLENNLKYFSKNGFIQMIERSYKDGEFKARRRSFHIYCTVCDSLVIIRENTIECGNDHLKKCIAKRRSKYIQKNTKKGGAGPRGTTLSRKSVSSLSSDEIEKIYLTYSVMDTSFLGIDETGIYIQTDRDTGFSIFVFGILGMKIWILEAKDDSHHSSGIFICKIAKKTPKLIVPAQQRAERSRKGKEKAKEEDEEIYKIFEADEYY